MNLYDINVPATAMTTWFFMSYARADDDYRDANLVQTFFEDLRGEVAGRLPDPKPGEFAGYLDQRNLNIGDKWPDDLARAVHSSRTFIAIMTARYFGREYCGKEWCLFEDRCRLYQRSLGHGVDTLPPLILPVLWAPPVEEDFPDFATQLLVNFNLDKVAKSDRLQLKDYAERGLLFVIKRKSTTHGNAYEAILEQLATRIIEVAKKNPLPDSSCNELPSIDQVESRFHHSDATAATAPDNVEKTASVYANFVIVAGKRTEMQDIRKEPERYYGYSESLEWLPYTPERPESIALIAQRQATERGLICRWLAVDDRLVNYLREAEEQNIVTIVVIDPWTTRHPDYARYLLEFDRNSFRNCVALVVWNPNHPDTRCDEPALRDELHYFMSRRYLAGRDLYTRDAIRGPEDLDTQIRTSITYLEGILASYRDPARVTVTGRYNRKPQVSASGEENNP